MGAGRPNRPPPPPEVVPSPKPYQGDAMGGRPTRPAPRPEEVPRARLADPPNPKYKLRQISKLVSGRLYQVLLIEEPCRPRNHFTVGERSRAPEKVLLLMGKTGVGKTTTINWLLNFVYGVKFDDGFRFQLIKPGTGTESDTREVTVYTIYHQEGMKIPYTLTIVDTPGFLSTGNDAMAEMESDQRTRKQLEDYFGVNKGEDEVNDIHAVCIVVNAANMRLTAAEQYAFDCITQIFGKDIKENIVIFFTFAAGRTQDQAEQVVKDAGVPYAKSFPFNHDDILSLPVEPGEDQDMQRMAWQKGEKQSGQFFQFMDKHIKRKTSKLTRKTLDERRKVGLAIQSLEEQIRSKLNELQTLSDLKQIVKRHAKEIDDRLDFKFMVEEECLETTKLDTDSWAMNCTVCQYTCHYPCKVDTSTCIAFGLGGRTCLYCPGKCSIDNHSKCRFTYDRVLRNQERSSEAMIHEVAKVIDDFKSRCTVGSTVSRSEGIYESIRVPLHSAARKEVVDKVKEIEKSLKMLEKVALVKEPQDPSAYIDILIEKEKGRGAKGYLNRIQQLEQIKEQYRMLNEVRGGQAPRI